jgi:hypothetical protein
MVVGASKSSTYDESHWWIAQRMLDVDIAVWLLVGGWILLFAAANALEEA